MEKIKELLTEVEGLNNDDGVYRVKAVNTYLPEFVKLSTNVGKDGLVIYDELSEEEVYRGNVSREAFEELKRSGLVWGSYRAEETVIMKVYSIHDNIFMEKERATSIQDGKGVLFESFIVLREGEIFNEGGYEYELFQSYDHAREELNEKLAWEKENGLTPSNEGLTIGESSFGMITLKDLLGEVERSGDGSGFVPEIVELSTHFHSEGVRIAKFFLNERPDETEVIYEGYDAKEAFIELQTQGLVWETFTAKENSVEKFYTLDDSIFFNKERAESLHDGTSYLDEGYIVVKKGERIEEGTLVGDRMQHYSREEALEELREIFGGEQNEKTFQLENIFKELSPIEQDYFIAINELNVYSDINIRTGEESEKLSTLSLNLSDEQIEKVDNLYKQNIFVDTEYMVSETKSKAPEGMIHGDDLRELVKELPERDAVKISAIQLERVFKELSPVEQDYFIAINELNVYSDINLSTGEEFEKISALSLNLSVEQIEKVDNLYEQNIFVDIEYRVSDTKANAPEGLIHGNDLNGLLKTLPKREVVEMSSIDKEVQMKNVLIQLTPEEKAFFMEHNNYQSNWNISAEDYEIYTTARNSLSEEQVEKVESLYNQNIHQGEGKVPEGTIYIGEVEKIVGNLNRQTLLENENSQGLEDIFPEKKENVRKAAKKKNNDFER